MIRIAACEDCSIIYCMSDPNNSRDHGIVGVFVCRGCLQMKGWHQSMDDIEERETDRLALAQFVPDQHRLDVTSVSKIHIVECPYGRRAKVRFSMCVNCYKDKEKRRDAFARLVQERGLAE